MASYLEALEKGATRLNEVRITGQSPDLDSGVQHYRITTDNLFLGGHGNQVLVDQSTHTTFNFYDCNIDLQGDLNDLAQLLTEAGEKEEAKKLENTAKALEQLEQCKSKDEVKKKGLASRLRRVVEDLGDKDSKLGKTVKGIENGIEIAQSIAKRYNNFADWMGFPQVPKLFL